MIMVGKG